MTPAKERSLADILDSGPVAYGFLSGVWTSLMIARLIQEEFIITCHPGHVRRLLHQLGFSVQRPRRKLARASRYKQDRWHRYTYPNLKKNAQTQGSALIMLTKRAFDRTPPCTGHGPDGDTSRNSPPPVSGRV